MVEEKPSVGSLSAHDFMGKNGFLWFIGVVVDNNDPLKFGRARLRIFGHHHHDPSVLPTNALPWAMALAPLNNSTVPNAPSCGSMVFGFFLDGSLAQQPVMIGCLVGYRYDDMLKSNQ